MGKAQPLCPQPDTRELIELINGRTKYITLIKLGGNGRFYLVRGDLHAKLEPALAWIIVRYDVAQHVVGSAIVVVADCDCDAKRRQATCVAYRAMEFAADFGSVEIRRVRCATTHRRGSVRHG